MEIFGRGPHNGASNAGAVWKNHIFRPISRFISEMIQDRTIDIMERQSICWMLSFPVTSSDLECFSKTSNDMRGHKLLGAIIKYHYQTTSLWSYFERNTLIVLRTASLCLRTVQMYPGAYHKLHSEADGQGEEVISDIAKWITDVDVVSS